jgi:hypothetical protein
MSTITALGLDSTLIANTQTSTAQQASLTTSSPDTVTIDTSTHNNSLNNIDISTRAQKIQALNEEFFSAGPQSLVISSDFLQRLEQYGLITSEQANTLGADIIDEDEMEAKPTVSDLSLFIADFTGRLEQSELSNNSLIDALQNAKMVLEHVNSPTDESKNINIVQVSQQLKTYTNSATEQLSESEKTSLKYITSALDIANVLTPGTHTTAQINSYLAISTLGN